MAAGALGILASPELWGRMSECGRRIAETRFSAPTVIGMYEDYYREVLGR